MIPKHLQNTSRPSKAFIDSLIESHYVNNHVGRLTPEQIRDIRTSDLPMRALADKHGVSVGSIINVRDGITYKWVADE